MTRRIHLGISTCPNDTFAFHALLEGAVDSGALDFEVELHDVEELNQRLARGDFDVAKGSFHAALLMSEELTVLPSGAALGFGVGPVLLAAPDRTLPEEPVDDAGGLRPARVLCPGAWTTATLLYRMFHPEGGTIEQGVFSEIMPALEAGTADFGVCIHEGRFTWQHHGLGLVEDLGETWERRTRQPLPLGGILARSALGPECLREVQDCVRASLEYGLAHPERTLPTMRRHAQEADDAVLWRHVDLYVNNWSRELGAEGAAALEALHRVAIESGLIPADRPGISVLAP